MTTKTIAYRPWSAAYPVFYVAQVKGDGGVDWGYSTNAKDACHLSPYWVRRFKADCQAVGVEATILTVNL